MISSKCFYLVNIDMSGNSFFGPADVRVIAKAAHWQKDMGASHAKGHEHPDNSHHNPDPHPDDGSDSKIHGLAKCCHSLCLKINFVGLSVLTVLIALAVIIVTILTALATQLYSSDLSGRIVAMIVLAVTAAIAISMVIYAVISLFKVKNNKQLHAAVVVLVILALIQVVVLIGAIRLKADDEVSLGRFMSESFQLAHQSNSRHVKLWASTQHDLTCCGVNSPEDYRPSNAPAYFAPDVPVSCCPNYDPDRSELLQERERETCKARRQYYQIGCKEPLVNVFKDTANWVKSITIPLIILEILLAIIGGSLSKQNKKLQKSGRRSAEDGLENPNASVKAAPKEPEKQPAKERSGSKSKA